MAALVHEELPALHEHVVGVPEARVLAALDLGPVAELDRIELRLVATGRRRGRRDARLLVDLATDAAADDAVARRAREDPLPDRLDAHVRERRAPERHRRAVAGSEPAGQLVEEEARRRV